MAQPDAAPDLRSIISRRLKGNIQQAMGPHGLSLKYQMLYSQAAVYVGKWLREHGTPKELCAGIVAGEPILAAAMLEINDDALAVMRHVVRNDLTDLGQADIDTIINRLAAQAPLHHAILTSHRGSPCPFCRGSHIEWTREQFMAVLATLRTELNGTAGA